ncbi:MAG: phosphate ABC transporter substrate-binding protein [Oscillatoria princeps RMCB-10]|jgi:phosphate transport system substrate-binding protein|nr:phosphate ABC transporter substrate-binding protein [Oscillatoria princeps RMCB-10]
MAKSSGPPPIVFILLFLLLAGGGYWWFFMRKDSQQATLPSSSTNAPGTPPGAPLPSSSPIAAAPFPPPTSVPAGTNLRIDGSTSMVTINVNLKNGFQRQFPGTIVTANTNGTDKGIQALLVGSVDIAAISRPLTSQELSSGLVAVPVALDAIAVVVGANNPWKGGLSSGQIEDIFEGKIADWSGVGGSAGQIRVINRPAVSGTHQTFKELVLGGGNFGTTPNITTLPNDETTGLLRELKTDGIGYATYTQVAKQQTVRVVPVNGITPDSPTYPFRRALYYVYKNPASPAVQAFLGYTASPQGQQAMLSGG